MDPYFCFIAFLLPSFWKNFRGFMRCPFYASLGDNIYFPLKGPWGSILFHKKDLLSETYPTLKRDYDYNFPLCSLFDLFYRDLSILIVRLTFNKMFRSLKGQTRFLSKIRFSFPVFHQGPSSTFQIQSPFCSCWWTIVWKLNFENWINQDQAVGRSRNN